jgi:hypothetical protein
MYNEVGREIKEEGVAERKGGGQKGIVKNRPLICFLLTQIPNM